MENLRWNGHIDSLILKIVYLCARIKTNPMALEKEDNSKVNPEIGGPVLVAIIILALIVLAIWMAS